MISCHSNKSKSSVTSWVNPMRPGMYGPVLHQKSIKTYCPAQSNLVKRLIVKQNIERESKQNTNNKVNDQNCSFNANTLIETEGIKAQSKALIVVQSKRSNDFEQEQEVKQNKHGQVVINLKKKIKKCTSHQISRSQSYFRQKVSFVRKGLLKRQTQHDNMLNTQNGMRTEDKIQSFSVYRDSEELRNRIVVQRMDNDGDTDDQQIEKFVNKVKTQFLFHISKAKKERQSDKSYKKPISEKPIQERFIQERPIQERFISEKPIQERFIEERFISEKDIIQVDQFRRY